MLEQFHQKKYLVVGANSFLAKEIIGRLKDKHEVSCVYHTQKNNLFDELTCVKVSEIDKLEDQYDVVIIISAYVPPKGKAEDVNLLMDVNARLPERICRQFRSAKIVYASSVAVYGEGGRILSESSAPIQPSMYGLSKLEGEKIVSSSPANSIVRISSMYDSGMNPGTFLPQIIDAALKEKKITLYGDGLRRQNYIHVSDVAEFFIRASESTSNGVFLAAGEQSHSNLAVANEVKSILKDSIVVFEGEDRSVSFDYSAEETYRRLGYRPQINIHEGILALIQWQQKVY